MNIWPFSYIHTLELRKKCRGEAKEAGEDARDAARQLREAILKATATKEEEHDR